MEKQNVKNTQLSKWKNEKTSSHELRSYRNSCTAGGRVAESLENNWHYLAKVNILAVLDLNIYPEESLNHVHQVIYKSFYSSNACSGKFSFKTLKL